MKPLRELAKGYQYMRDEDGNSWVVFLAPSSTTPTTALVWPYGGAPPECFADAPAEPLVEERTLRSPDGAFVMTVWLKDYPPRIEARIEQQPEEWRGDGGTVKVIAPRGTLPRLAVHSYLSPYLFGHALVLRGRERDRDGVVFECRFETSSDRDAHLAKLKATVAAMPRLADQFKVGDRVVVAGNAMPDGGTIPEAKEYVGLHGTLTGLPPCDRGFDNGRVALDGGGQTYRYLINLRHERDDERPAEKRPEPLRANFPPPQYHGGFPVLPIAEKKPDPEGWMREFCPVPASAFADKSALEATEASLLVWRGRRKENLAKYGLAAPLIGVGGNNCPLCKTTPMADSGFRRDCSKCPLQAVDATACRYTGAYGAYADRGDPEPMIASLEKCLEQEQAKQEPKQEPPKFALGQWYKSVASGYIYVCVERTYSTSLHEWSYKGHRDGNAKNALFTPEYNMRPCPPVVTDAMKLLCWPGTKVRVAEHPVDAAGKPYPADGRSHESCAAGRTGTALATSNQAAPEVEIRCDGVWYRIGPWNLEPAEEK